MQHSKKIENSLDTPMGKKLQSKQLDRYLADIEQHAKGMLKAVRLARRVTNRERDIKTI